MIITLLAEALHAARALILKLNRYPLAPPILFMRGLKRVYKPRASPIEVTQAPTYPLAISVLVYLHEAFLLA